MGKINVLDSTVFNRIAAGEVVENPRSIVKELVENSIDSGADNITVDIRNGGISYISVSDNGKGIDKDDMPVAFMPHATSKIKDLKDLETISTLGFRGEALPSIASVAEVQMSSRSLGHDLGYKLSLKDGKIVEEGECGIPYGTKVTVKNLFAHIPARAKFLRKPQAEESSVTEFIAKIILANPYLKIKYTADDETIYQSDGNGVESAIYNVYGAEFLSNMTEILHVMPDIKISGYVCRPDYTKHNRNYQTLIVNGRYIVNTEMSYCIQQCYQNYLMKRQFPAYVLYIDIPSDMVDVNVHPNKLDVRFSCEKRLKGIVYNAVKNKIDDLATEPIIFAQPLPQITTKDSEQIDANVNRLDDLSVARSFTPITPSLSETTIIKTKFDNFVQNAFYATDTDTRINNNNDRHDENKRFDISQPLKLFEDENEIRPTGKLFNTYILAESGNNFYLIDQHAAHEKILYDKLVKQMDNGETFLQDLLVPYIFDVSPSEKTLMDENLPRINSCGFKIDALSGNSYSLYALPVCCSKMDLKNFISILLQNIEEIKNNSDFLKENIMQAACKSAVKGEDDLAPGEICDLIKQMNQSESAKFCPHGRPTVIKFSKYDLEKLFKRA